MINLLKKMGFDIKKIDDKRLKKELYALLTVYFDEYELYEKPYEKKIFANEPAILDDIDTLKYSIGIDNFRLYNDEIIDASKKCMRVEGYNIHNNILYIFDVIYDTTNDIYTIKGYPIVMHGFDHHDFSDYFWISYDVKSNTLKSKKYGKRICNNLLVESHVYDNNANLSSTYQSYSGIDISNMEKTTHKTLYEYNNLENMLTSQTIMTSFCTREKIKINDQIYPISNKNKALFINEIIAYERYKNDMFDKIHQKQIIKK